ncbi:HNH endonuclease [Halomonas sp. YJPS3-2]|nr:HNH endonuclease [Halomonas getboli]
MKHDEHIIQQAIGGVLKSNNILCETCGEILGRAVDAPFSMMFDSICTRLDIKKDRGNNKGTAKGVVFSNRDAYGNDLSGVEVFWKDSKVTPVKPIHKYSPDNSKVVVYASAKQLKSYKERVRKEVDERYDDGCKPEIVVCDDLSGVITYPLELDDEAFKKGFAKIAIGFASRVGVDRDVLNLVLDVEQNKIKDNVSLLPFYPKGVFDDIVERDKKNIRHYPSHTLILFTAASRTNLLVCYVELFSTFQFYVILSDQYDGKPIYEGYQQRLDKRESYIFKPDRRYYKERGMILSSLGIDQQRIDNAYEKQKEFSNAKTAEEIEYKIIQDEYMKQKYYVDFDEEVKIAIDYASMKLIEPLDQLSLKNVTDTLSNARLFYRSDENDEEFFDVSSYRRCFFSGGECHDYVFYLKDFYETCEGRKKRKEYGHNKLYMLSGHMEIKNIKEKLEA